MSFFPGDNWKPSASREREVTRLLEAARGERASFGVPGKTKMEPGHVLVRNDTGADLEFGKFAMITHDGYFDQDLSPRKDPEYRSGFYKSVALAPIISNMTPRFERMGVTVEPIPNNKFGIMAIAGLAVCTYGFTTGYIAPIPGNNVLAGMFGFAKVVAYPQRGNNFCVVDMSCHNMYAPYKLTAISGGGRTARFAESLTPSSSYTSAVYDDYGIASWQVVDDGGLAFWNGSKWVIVVPWCVGGDQ